MSESAFEPRRVLIVDDEKSAADTLVTVLRMSGHEAAAVYDGATALTSAEHFAPDVVLLDLQMPDLDGYATCRRMRERPWGQSLCIVAVTGWEDVKGRSKRAGFDFHLVKPVDFDALEQLLAAL